MESHFIFPLEINKFSLKTHTITITVRLSPTELLRRLALANQRATQKLLIVFWKSAITKPFFKKVFGRQRQVFVWGLTGRRGFMPVRSSIEIRVLAFFCKEIGLFSNFKNKN